MLLIDRPVKFVLTGQLRGGRVLMSILLIPVMFLEVVHILLIVVMLLFMIRCARRPYELFVKSVLISEIARGVSLLLLLSTLIFKLL